MPWYFWIPIGLLVFMLLTLGVLFALSRYKGGRYLQSAVRWLAKFALFRKLFVKMSDAALARSNPELASAMQKMRALGEPTNPQQAQKALSMLTPGERRAYLDAVGEQMPDVELTNRQQRRRMEHGGAGMPVRPGTKGRPSGRGKKR